MQCHSSGLGCPPRSKPHLPAFLVSSPGPNLPQWSSVNALATKCFSFTLLFSHFILFQYFYSVEPASSFLSSLHLFKFKCMIVLCCLKLKMNFLTRIWTFSVHTVPDLVLQHLSRTLNSRYSVNPPLPNQRSSRPSFRLNWSLGASRAGSGVNCHLHLLSLHAFSPTKRNLRVKNLVKVYYKLFLHWLLFSLIQASATRSKCTMLYQTIGYIFSLLLTKTANYQVT